MRQFIAQGQNHQQVLASFVREQGPRGADGAAERGLQPHRAASSRSSPAWPVSALVGITAFRWSRRKSDAAAPAAPIDPALDARLDDELRDLD